MYETGKYRIITSGCQLPVRMSNDFIPPNIDGLDISVKKCYAVASSVSMSLICNESSLLMRRGISIYRVTMKAPHATICMAISMIVSEMRILQKK